MRPLLLALVCLSPSSWGGAAGDPALPTIPAELLRRARELAAEEWKERTGPELPHALTELDYDGYRRLRFRPDAALWRHEGRRFEVRFHHRGYLFQAPVTVHEVAPDGSRPVPYDPAAFDAGELELPEGTGPDLGFAGFSVFFPLHGPESNDEVASFLGASYFRLIGEGQDWGASTRGLAVDTGLPAGEEFPRFVEYWIERPASDADELTVHALLDSPSVTGAYSIRLGPGPETRAAVVARLFSRRAIEKLGIAPLTSMHLFGENAPNRPSDYRPEVHDSDGLLVAEESGVWTWRPLSNPRGKHRITRFETSALRGFGLMQRDRRFESYQDLESRFEKRPSLWVEPVGAWGPGAVELVEIPVNSEANDNVVAFWVPEEPLGEDEELELAYVLRATTADAVLHDRARVHATRCDAPAADVARFVVDYLLPEGGSPTDGEAAPVPRADFEGSEIDVRGGEVVRNPVTGGWRVVFEVTPPGDREARLSLRLAGGEGGDPTPPAERWSAVVRARETP